MFAHFYIHICRIIQIVTLFFFITPLLGSQSTSPFLFESKDGRFKQLQAIYQNEYEDDPSFDETKPTLLKGQKNLCGLFALYNGICLLQACDQPDQALTNIKKLTSIESFHSWIEQELDTLEKIKQESIRQKVSGSLGSLDNLIVKRIAQSILNEEQYNRFNSFSYRHIEGNEKIYYGFVNFSERFKKSTNPFLVVFNFDNHFITVILDLATTWIIDSGNINRVNDPRIKRLDQFMREGSLSEKFFSEEGIINKLLSIPRKALKKVWNSLPLAASAA